MSRTFMIDKLLNFYQKSALVRQSAGRAGPGKNFASRGQKTKFVPTRPLPIPGDNCIKYFSIFPDELSFPGIEETSCDN